jgi:GT2 family glycosyltransferase
VLSQKGVAFEVIVVDNGSTDGSPDFVAKNFPQVQLIRNARNLGFAIGVNIGIKAAIGDVIVLLNQDTVVQEGWLKALVEALWADGKVGIAGCKLLYPDGKTIQHAGGTVEYPSGLALHYGYREKDEGQWDEPRDVDYVTGAAMAIRRDVLERVGLFDEGFSPAYFEDIDICYRAREKGFLVRYVPHSILIHHESSSIGDKLLSFYYQRSRIRFILKHYTPQQILDDFLASEEAGKEVALQRGQGRALRRAYLEGILIAPRILMERWGADAEAIVNVVEGLQKLREDLSEAEFEGCLTNIPETKLRPTPATIDQFYEKASLKEFTFASKVPLIGPFIIKFRELCHSISAKWALRHLIQQQTAFNLAMLKTIKDITASLNEMEKELYRLALDRIKMEKELHRLALDRIKDESALAVHLARFTQESLLAEDDIKSQLRTIEKELKRLENWAKAMSANYKRGNKDEGK